MPRPNEPDAAESRGSVSERELQGTPTVPAVLATCPTSTPQPADTAEAAPQVITEARVVGSTRPVEVISTPTRTVEPAQKSSLAQTNVTPLPPTVTSTPDVAAAATAWPTSVPTTAQAARVVAVVDGAIIDVLIDDQPASVRYIGVDSPDSNSRAGAQATSANAALLADQVVYLLADTTDRDRAGRLLRYVYLPDGSMVNEELVRTGHLRSVASPPDTANQAIFDAAQQTAQAESAGMWQELAWASASANIRTGPGTQYSVVAGAQPGEALDIVGRTSEGDWFQLGSGGWIFAELVSNPPVDVPVVPTPAP